MDVSKFISDPEVALLVIMLIGAISAFALGKVIPRYIYDREVSNNALLFDALEAMTPALTKMAEAVEANGRRLDRLEAQLQALTDEARRK